MKENNSKIDKVDSLESAKGKDVQDNTSDNTEDVQDSASDNAKVNAPGAIEACEPKAIEASIPEAAKASKPELAKTSKPKNAETSEPKVAETTKLEFTEATVIKTAKGSETPEASDVSKVPEALETTTAHEATEAAGNLDVTENLGAIENYDTSKNATASEVSEATDLESDNIETEPIEKKKLTTKQKATIGGSIGILVLIAAFTALIVSGAFLSPAERFQRIQRAAIFNPIIESVEGQDYLSTDITVSLGLESAAVDMATLLIQSLVESIALEINIDATPTRAVYRYGLGVAGSDLISLTYVVDSIERYFGFYVSELDSNYYTIDWDTIYSLQGMEGLFDENGNDIFSPEAIRNLIENQADIFLSMVNDSNIQQSRETLSLFNGSEEVRSTLYTFTPNEIDIYDMLTALLQEIRENSLYFLYFTMVNDSDYQRLGYDSPRHHFDSVLDELQTMLCSFSRAVVDSNFTWRTAISGRQLLMQEISFSSPEGDDFMLRYEGHGRRGHRTDWLTLKGNLTVGFISNEFNISLQNEMILGRRNVEGTAKLYFQNYASIGDVTLGLLDGMPDFLLDAVLDEAVDRVMGDGEKRELLKAKYNFDLRNQSILRIPYGTLQVQIYDASGDTLLGLSATVQEGDHGGTDHILSIPSIEGLDGLGITIYMHSTDEPSSIEAPHQNPVDLSGYSMEEIEPILSNMTQQLQSIIFDMILGNIF